jgi:hypothetical protein
MKLDAYAKAIIAALSSGVIMFFTLKSNGLTAEEWATIITSALAAGGFTWAVPNAAQTTTNKTTLEVQTESPMLASNADTWVGTAEVPGTHAAPIPDAADTWVEELKPRDLGRSAGESQVGGI